MSDVDVLLARELPHTINPAVVAWIHEAERLLKQLETDIVRLELQLDQHRRQRERAFTWLREVLPDMDTDPGWQISDAAWEAAEEIKQLRAEVERLREADSTALWDAEYVAMPLAVQVTFGRHGYEFREYDEPIRLTVRPAVVMGTQP